jgi:hypothetical protein
MRKIHYGGIVVVSIGVGFLGGIFFAIHYNKPKEAVVTEVNQTPIISYTTRENDKYMLVKQEDGKYRLLEDVMKAEIQKVQETNNSEVSTEVEAIKKKYKNLSLDALFTQ